MKFTCEKALLQQAIGVASRTVALKSPNPALEGILIQAGDHLQLTGYNLETGIRSTVPANIVEKGSIVLSPRLFGDIVRRLDDEEVTVVSDNFTVTITCGNSEFNIQGTDSAAYPDLPAEDFANTIKMHQKTLKSMISQTLFAVSTSQTRPVHTGSLFEIDEDGFVTIVSVDGFRLAVRKEKAVSTEGVPAMSFVVPGVALNEVEKICGDIEDDEKPVEFALGGRHILFRVKNEDEDITLISRRLEGEFLNYRKSLPDSSPIVLYAARKQLITSVDRVSLIIAGNQKSPLQCTFEKDLLRIRTRTAIGDAYDECPVNGDGKGLEIGFNSKYLMDALKACPADEIRIEMNKQISPCIIRPVDRNDESFIYMVLPVRLRAGV